MKKSNLRDLSGTAWNMNRQCGEEHGYKNRAEAGKDDYKISELVYFIEK